MPDAGANSTPGVYVGEISAFPPSIVGVQTAVPVFVGYTGKAEIGGKPIVCRPISISSLAAFEEVFGGAHKPLYALAEVGDAETDVYDVRVIEPATGTARFYRLDAEGPSFNLYNAMRLFYANGGGSCYVVSAGLYGDVTATVDKTALLAGLAAAAEQVGPTMLVVPDAVLLPPDSPAKPWVSTEYGEVASAMLRQGETLRDRVAVLDVYGTQHLSQPAAAGAAPTLDDVIGAFRVNVGDAGLSYGMAYFPFVNTSIVSPAEVAYTSIDDAPSGTGSVGALRQILTWENANLYGKPADPAVPTPRQVQVQADIDRIGTVTDPADVKALDAVLTAALPLLAEMERVVATKEGVLPAAPALAGVMTYVDGTRGVWNAPANVSLTAVASPTVVLDNNQQEGLNVPLDGKAVDVLRAFPGRGTVVWGARTLDGNSADYRYIQVRRTLIYIEQSIKNALEPFTFAPNTGQTWATVVSMVSSFLQSLWSQGGLMGATPADAFSVACGVGSTMTGTDVLNGWMIVQVTLSLIRPAEFIELTFKQKMEDVD